MNYKETSAEHKTNAIATGRVAGVNALEQMSRMGIGGTTEAEDGGCANWGLSFYHSLFI